WIRRVVLRTYRASGTTEPMPSRERAAVRAPDPTASGDAFVAELTPSGRRRRMPVWSRLAPSSPNGKMRPGAPRCLAAPVGLPCAEGTAHMPSKTAAPKPLKQLQDLLPKITHSELLELTELAHEELARRVSTFADAVCEVDEPPVDL